MGFKTNGMPSDAVLNSSEVECLKFDSTGKQEI